MASNPESARPASRTVRLTCSNCGKPFRVLESQRSDVVSCPHCTTEIDVSAQLRAASLVGPLLSDHTVNPFGSGEDTERMTGEPLERMVDAISLAEAEAQANASGIRVEKAQPEPRTEWEVELDRQRQELEQRRQAEGGWCCPATAWAVAAVRWAYRLAIAACIVVAWFMMEVGESLVAAWLASLAPLVWLAGRLHALEHALKYWRRPSD